MVFAIAIFEYWVEVERSVECWLIANARSAKIDFPYIVEENGKPTEFQIF